MTNCGCGEGFVQFMAARGISAQARPWSLGMSGPDELTRFDCKHETRWFVEPTAEQVERWTTAA